MTLRSQDGQGGFTLVEALATMAIVGLMMSGLAAIAGQWLPQWRHGYLKLETSDRLAQSLSALCSDLAAAEYARLDPGAGSSPFRGGENTVIFVRAATGPGATPRLEYIKISAVATKDGMETQRASAVFSPGPIGPFRDPVTLLREPFRLSFAYQAPDGRWASSWGEAPTLPRAVRLMVKSGAVVITSTVAAVRTTSGPDVFAQPDQQDDEQQPLGANAK